MLNIAPFYVQFSFIFPLLVIEKKVDAFYSVVYTENYLSLFSIIAAADQACGAV